MEARSTSYHAQALARGVGILRQLAESRVPLGLNALHRATALPRSTLLRLLATLEEENLVTCLADDDGDPRYSLGHGILTLAAGYRQSVDAEARARPPLRDLARRLANTSNLGVLAGRSVLHVCVVEPDRPMRFRSTSGSLDETYCTGLGKMLLASLPAEGRARHLPPEPFAAFTPHTLTTLEQLEGELETVAARGYSVDDEERDVGVRCVAVPVTTVELDGFPAAVSVSGPAGELSPNRLPELLTELNRTAEEIHADANLLAALRVTAGAPEVALLP